MNEIYDVSFGGKKSVSEDSDYENTMASLKDIKILVADDYPSMRAVIKVLLKKIGFKNVVEAEDGTDAWEFVKKGDIDLVVSDWNMPKMPGIELLRRIRKSDEFRDLPFLLVTAEGFKESVMQAVSAGVSEYIVKPFTQQTLEKKIFKIMGNS